VGLGHSSAVKDVVVKWPWGKTEHFGPQQTGRYVELVEDRGQSKAALAAPAGDDVTASESHRPCGHRDRQANSG
jgi:hypothetical protein